MTRPLATTSADISARYHVDRDRRKRGASTLKTAPAYATDGIAIPRRKRRVLLDLAPDTVERLLAAVQAHGQTALDVTAEHLLIEALEKAR
jgi:hypothetical protein